MSVPNQQLYETTGRGIQAVRLSLVLLGITAVFQAVVVWYTGSVGLLADTIHNVGDALTAIPLWIAFVLMRRMPTRRFSYGYGRLEDLGGLVVVVAIWFSAAVAAWQSFERFLHPQQLENIPILAAAAIIGYLGNEAVARVRINAGRAIHSDALIADGQHARTDSWTSLAVLLGAIGAFAGYPIADTVVGALVSLAIMYLGWQTGRDVISRLIDGVDPKLQDEVRRVAAEVNGVVAVAEVRARWLGHRLHAEVNIAVEGAASVVEGHNVAKRVHHELTDKLDYLHSATIHVDPHNEQGEKYHGT